MKKLMKNVICGTHEQCISALFTTDFSQKVRLKQKKKGKCSWLENATQKRGSKLPLNP